jgi:pantoate kinase
MTQKISSSAYAPAHATGFFCIFPDGATGAGFNPIHGAITRVELNKSKSSEKTVSINGKVLEAKVSNKVLESFTEYLDGFSLEIYHALHYPIGYGMGMSAAGAFSLALALNNALDSRFDFNECMQIARRADIFCGTGLGDVVAQQFSGVLMGLPPYPSMTSRQLACNYQYVVCGFFDSMETAKIIKDDTWKEKINKSGKCCMEEIDKNSDTETFIRLSRKFTFETGLASPQVLQVMEAIPSCSMSMLGQTVFLFCNDPIKAEADLRQFTDRILISGIANTGARVL